MLIPRQNTILDMARQSGRVTVDELAQRFEVTPQTIRKDLNELCEQRLLTRIHGGAILSSGVENVGYDARRMIASDEKEAIARAAAARIPDHASLFINIGTTTEAVARALLQHSGLMVITNNLNVASLMRAYPQIEVVIAGRRRAPHATAAWWARRPSISSASSRWISPSSVPRRSTRTGRSSTTTTGRCGLRRPSSPTRAR